MVEAPTIWSPVFVGRPSTFAVAFRSEITWSQALLEKPASMAER
jgi:hypothetical protein